MPYSIKEALTMWADQFDWEPLRKVTDAVITGVVLGCLVDFWIIAYMKL